MLSHKHIQDVCLVGHLAGVLTCRYVQQDRNDYTKWVCLKHKKAEKNRIDDKVDAYVLLCLKKGLDPTAIGGMALGDNCAGYPILKYIEQGYDHD